ncbi:MAG: tol-pal system-associated acyl-CoA thioesterase [Burkholderiales bacterium]|nr:tol-pal system-associated acyl-CoA thioesterase [Burkholderiales bacterium]
MRLPEGHPGEAMPQFAIDLRVYYQDTDAGAVVYHATYLNFFERARTEWLRHLGFDLPRAAREGCLFIVRRMQLRFVRPAMLDDLVRVSVALEHLGRAQMTLQQRVTRATDELVEASVNLACVDPRSFRPVALPGALRACLSPYIRTVSEQEEQV